MQLWKEDYFKKIMVVNQQLTTTGKLEIECKARLSESGLWRHSLGSFIFWKGGG